MPPIGAMGFSPDGSQLWTATHGSIEIRSWPELSLIARTQWARPLPPHVSDGLPTQHRQALTFHPAGRIAALAYRSAVFLLDSSGTLLDREPILPAAGVQGIAFAEDGRVVIANSSGAFAAGPGGALERLGVPPNGPLPTWIWRAAIAPWERAVFYCVNDEAALLYTWDTGHVQRDGDWHSGDDPPSWLAADFAPGGRAYVFGDKNGETWIVEPGPRLVVRSARVLQKTAARRPEKMKLPMRTTTHAIHPTEDAIVFAEISGFVFHAKLSTGEIVRELPRAGAGYAWE